MSVDEFTAGGTGSARLGTRAGSLTSNPSTLVTRRLSVDGSEAALDEEAVNDGDAGPVRRTLMVRWLVNVMVGERSGSVLPLMERSGSQPLKYEGSNGEAGVVRGVPETG